MEFYDPATAFGAWAYPDYPPYYFPRVYYDIVRPIPIITPLWGWSSWDWRGRHLRLDVGRWRLGDRHLHRTRALPLRRRGCLPAPALLRRVETDDGEKNDGNDRSCALHGAVILERHCARAR